jgi:hypothetical protein
MWLGGAAGGDGGSDGGGGGRGGSGSGRGNQQQLRRQRRRERALTSLPQVHMRAAKAIGDGDPRGEECARNENLVIMSQRNYNFNVSAR